MNAETDKQSRWAVVLGRLAACLICLLMAAAGRADGSFESVRQAAVAQNPPGLTCALSLPAGRTQFRQGEVIHAVLGFSSDRPSIYWKQNWSWGPGFETLHVSPSEGTADPQADAPQQTAFAYEGPPPPTPSPITDTPSTVTLTVNRSLRFDRPGLYQLYVTTTRVVDSGASHDVFPLNTKTFTATSNVVQLQIVPADPAWAHTQVQAALAEVQEPSHGPMNVPDPWDVLCDMDTPESAQALLGILAADPAPRSSDSKGYFCRPGLIGYPDQDWLIGEMERDLSAPDYTVTQDFLATLADLAAWRKTPQSRDNKAMLRAYWLRAADAVPTKTDAARPMTLHTLLESAWLDPSVGQDSAVQARLPMLSHQMALDFDHLPPLPQQYLLDSDWGDFHTSALLPSLNRLWAQAIVPQNNDYTVNDLILRRIYELSPDAGRRLILQEMTAPNPRASADALEILPDATLPGLDDTLAAHLAANQNVDVTCQLVARYATASILPRAQAFYAQMQDSTTEPALLAYFLRVQSDYGDAMLHQELRHWLGRGMQETLLSDVALVRYNAALERYALGELDSPDPGVVADAARTLGQYGSASTEAALWARLRQRDADLKSRAVVEQGLVTALATGQGWYTSPAKLRTIRSLCLTSEAQQEIDGLLSQLGTGPVNINYETGTVGYGAIGQYNSRGSAAFLAKLAQFPSGTAFLWQDIGYGPDEEQIFQQAQAVARAHGSSVRRWQPKATP